MILIASVLLASSYIDSMEVSSEDVILGTNMKAKATIPRSMSAKYHLDMSKRLLPRPLVFWSHNERDAYRRNRTAQIRFNTTVEHLRVQHEVAYRNICDEERRFAQKYLSRYLRADDKFDRRTSSTPEKLDDLSRHGMSLTVSHFHMASDDMACMDDIAFAKNKSSVPKKVTWTPLMSVNSISEEMEGPSNSSYKFVMDLRKGNGNVSVLQIPRLFHSSHIRQGQHEHVRPRSLRDIPASALERQIILKSRNHPGIQVTSAFQSKNRQEEEKQKILQHQENFLAYVKAMAEKHSRRTSIDVKLTVC